jgi:hypothetical protein
MIQSSLTKSTRARPARNLSSNTGFKQQLKYSFFQKGFDKTVMESSLPAFQVLGQARDGLHRSRVTRLERFDQERPKAWFGKISLRQTVAIECPSQRHAASLVREQAIQGSWDRWGGWQFNLLPRSPDRQVSDLFYNTSRSDPT